MQMVFQGFPKLILHLLFAIIGTNFFNTGIVFMLINKALIRAFKIAFIISISGLRASYSLQNSGSCINSFVNSCKSLICSSLLSQVIIISSFLCEIYLTDRGLLSFFDKIMIEIHFKTLHSFSFHICYI